MSLDETLQATETLRRIEAAAREREHARWEKRARGRIRFRQGVMLLVLAASLGGLGVRVSYWQIQQHALLASWAKQEHLREISIPAGRGRILDANGEVLALSVTEDTVIVDPLVLREGGPIQTMAARLATAVNMPAALVLKEVNVPGEYAQLKGTDHQPVLLSTERARQVQAALQQVGVPGVSLLPQAVRVYPAGTLAAQVLGFTRTSDGIGQYGIEQIENALLAGQPGSITTTVDAAGNPLAGGAQAQTSPVAGDDVRLTIDANVQYWVEQGLAQTVKQMGAEKGTVIVLDAQTGAVTAMASVPGFDPNHYAQTPSADAFKNPAVQDTYDPGSVLKAMTMAAGIDTHAITPDWTVYDTGSTNVEGVTISNFDGNGHGYETPTQILQYSANVGAIGVERVVGRDRLTSYLKAFGFTSATGVGLPGEQPGYFAPASSDSQRELNAAENSFGEGIQVTPLQVVDAYDALATGGVLLRPYIVASVAPEGTSAASAPGPHVVRRVVSAETASTVTRMLVDSARVSEARMNLVQGYGVAAKTGTSTPDATHPDQTNASVVGFAPASHPKFVLLVELHNPKTSTFGGEAAGPLWRSLAERLFAYDGIPPDADRATAP